MESLFVRPGPKKCRVCITLGASLLLHGGIIGIAGMWSQPEPAEHSVVLDWDISSIGGNAIPPPMQVNEPAPATPVPPVIDTSEQTPPTAEKDPLFYEPSQTPEPRRQIVSRPMTTLRANHSPTTVKSGLAPTRNTPSSVVGGLPSFGTGANSDAWVMPHPPYPRSLLLTRTPGATTIHITTDATGQISNVMVKKSTGNPTLDNYTETYVREHWHGPANTSRTTEFVYQLR